MKGMSAVIATILMLAITIALAGTAYLYISGILTGKISTSFSIIESSQDSVTIMNDGSSPITSFSSVKVDGADAVYRVSTQDDSTAGYYKFGDGSGTTADDSSGKGNTGTIYGATPVDGYFGKALYFDGNDYVDIVDSSLYFSDAVTEDKWTNTDDVLKYGKVLSFDSYPIIVDTFFNDDMYKISFQDEGGSIDDPNLTVRVLTSADDVLRYQATGFSTTSTVFDVGNSAGNIQHDAARFTNITIPQGAIIINAYINVTARITTSSSNVLTKVYAENVNNAAQINNATDFDGRALTTGTDWDISASWTAGINYTSPNISSEIQTVVNRAGWVSGNAINIFWKDDGSPSGNVRFAASWDSTTYAEPNLFIAYIIPPGDTIPPTASISINSDASTTPSTSVTLTLSCTDASGINAVRYSNDGVFDTETWEAFSSTRAWTLTSGDGTKTVWYQCRDNSANQNIATVSDTIILDTTPPARSNGQPSGITFPSGTTQTNINLTTDESSTCRYSNTTGTPYSSMTQFSTTGSTFHNQLITGLTNGNSYTYSVRCNDTVGNINTNDYNGISFSVAAPFNFTLIINPSSGGVIQGGNTSTIVTASLTSGSTQSVNFSASGLPSGASASFTPTSCNPTCSSNLTITTQINTSTGTYPINITGTGGILVRFTSYSLTVSSSDTIPPRWNNNQTNSTLAGSQVNHSVVLSDNIVLDYYIFEFWNGTSSGTNISTTDISGTIITANRTVRINSTVGSTIRWRYYFNDTSNNWNRTYLFNYTTTSVADTIPPSLSNGQPTGTLSAGTTSTNISLTAIDTTPPVSCRYSNTTGIAYSSMTNTLSNIGGNIYSATVSGLTNGNSYYYYVRCIDAVGNNNTNDFPINFSVATSGGFQPSNHTAITVEAWINPASTGTRYILANPYLNTQNSKYAIYVSSDNQLGVAQTSSLGSWNEVRGGANSVPNGVWTYVAYTWDAASGLGRFYINGNLVGSRADAGTVLGVGGDIRMGSHANNPSWYFNGIIDEVRIYNRSLPEQEIKANFDIGSQINSGQLSTLEIYNNLTAGIHTLRICTSSLCSTAYLTIV